MAISKNMAAAMGRSSWIRKMFEEGARLKALRGPENVCDFTLGNPTGEPPAVVKRRLMELAADPSPGTHRYMPNAGLTETRAQVARYLSGRGGGTFTENHVIMTVGAGGGLNVVIKSLCDPGDEALTVAPYFAEYSFYASNHSVELKTVASGARFGLEPERIEKAIGPKTRILLLNSPNNPTGAVYDESSLRGTGEILERKSKEHGRPIYLVMDEPYRKLVYDSVHVTNIFSVVRRAIAVTSHSKDLNLPGERIGYIAIGPGNDDCATMFDAMTMANRILGFVNAPALQQRLVGPLQDTAADMTVYSENRKILTDGLRQAGYDLTPPDGGFYLFPKSPLEDDVEFTGMLKERNVLVVPGAGFGGPGYFRISFCVEPQVCRRALPAFAQAMQEARAKL